MQSQLFSNGGYHYVPGVFQYSAGVAAVEGYEIIRVTFRHAERIATGFERIAAHLNSIDRPMASLCACEIRSPEPFSEEAFRDFNLRYVQFLAHAGLYRNGINPVARTNVCPELNPPSEPELYAFSYTVPSKTQSTTFVVAGSGEVPEGKSNYRDYIVHPGDTTVEALRAKARFVEKAMESRMASLGVTWRDATATQIYTVHDVHPLIPEIVDRGASQFGVTWHYCCPPVVGLDFEMDCRGVFTEVII